MPKFFHISSAALPLLAAVLVLTLSAGYFTLAWTEPSGAMPQSVAAPITIGSAAQTKAGSLTIGSTLSVQGSDFILGTNDGRAIGSKTGQRALVHFDFPKADSLYLNYGGDFEGGTFIDGTTTINGDLNVGGNINATGTINSATALCVNSVCASSTAWNAMVSGAGGGAPIILTVAGSIKNDFSGTSVTTQSPAYVKVLEYELGSDLDSCNFIFAAENTSVIVTVKLYKNGVFLGNYTTYDYGWDAFNKNFSGLKKGDLIQIYANAPSWKTLVGRASFSYDRKITGFGEYPLATSLTLGPVNIIQRTYYY
jgi:hypothetical protein